MKSAGKVLGMGSGGVGRHLAFMLIGLGLMAASSGASEFISPDEIEPGMMGHGLTVFQGTEPETFSVEAVGVLRNTFPKQDLVIIFANDPKLLESNVVAGMSGSPIYFKGRLLGALAYGPLFSKRPIAYVTPIQNMLQELDRPPEPARPWQRVSMTPDPGDAFGQGPGVSTLLPVESPLAVSGFSPSRIRILEKWLSPYGLIPMASGAASDRPGGPASFSPGSAVGVQLMRGDMAMTAIGTVTHVDAKGRVLAFGHPFFNIGQTSMPATTAHVHTFMPSVFRSYKLSSPLRTVGSMVQDRQPAIVIDPAVQSPMVPVSVTLENTLTGRRSDYRYEVIREQMLSPFLAFMGLAEALDVSEAGGVGDRAFEIRSRIYLKGRTEPVDLSDVSPSPFKALMDLMMLTENRIVEVVPTKFEFDAKVTNASRLAWIDSVKVNGRKYRAGDRVRIDVRLRTLQGQTADVVAGVLVPGNFPGRFADIEIRGGFGFSQPQPQPTTLVQVVRLMEVRPKGNMLISRLLQAPPAQTQSGEVLPNLPIFFQKILQGGVQGVQPAVVQQPYETLSTDWIILGNQRIQIEIEPEGRPK